MTCSAETGPAGSLPYLCSVPRSRTWCAQHIHHTHTTSSRRLESIQTRRAAAKQANREAARERKEREAAREEADRLQRERNKIAVRRGGKEA